MKAAYLDTSFLVAILFGEPGSPSLQRLLRRHDRLLAGDLLVAEAFAAAAREGVEPAALTVPLQAIALVFPPRSLESEMREALAHGRLRGADLWHLACAMFIAGAARSDLAFLSRDADQRSAAGRLGFPTP